MKNKGSNKKKLTDNKKLVLLFIGVAVFFAIVAAVVFFATRPTNKSYENCAVGDVDGSGYIDSGDCLLIQQYLGGNKKLFDSQIKNGDVNLDGKLDAADIEIIQKYSTGQIKKLPYKEDSKKTEIVEQNSAKHTTEEFESTVTVTNSWKNDDGSYSYQLSVTVKNLDDSRLRNWETAITLNKIPTISNSWDCESEIANGKIVITGDTIPAGESMSCGVIVKTDADMKILSIETTE